MSPTLYIDSDAQVNDDAEMERLAEYVGKLMTGEQEAQFEAELRADRAFFHRMAPILNVWYAREPLPEIVEAVEQMRADLAARRARAERRRHLLTALGSLFSLKPLIATAGLAAAAAVGYTMIQEKEHHVDSPPRAVAHGPEVPKAPPAAQAQHKEQQTPRVARGGTRKPARPAPTQQVAVVPVIDSTLEAVIRSLTSAPLAGSSVAASGVVASAPTDSVKLAVPAVPPTFITEVKDSNEPHNAQDPVNTTDPKVVSPGAPWWRTFIGRIFGRGGSQPTPAPTPVKPPLRNH